MGDAKAPYAALKSELDDAFQLAMENMANPDVPQVLKLAQTLQDYLQVRQVVPCSHGADALVLALQTLQLPQQAEVILPAFGDSFAAGAIKRLGLTPVFADVLPTTFTLDPVSVAKLITDKTVAIMPMHLFGQCADMAQLLALAETQQLLLLEDTTQALGAVYRLPGGKEQRAGTMGHLAFASLLPTKPLACQDEGGAVIVNSQNLCDTFQIAELPWATAAVQFQKTTTDTKIANLQAAMVEVKLRYLDQFNQARQEVAAVYDDLFKDTSLLQIPGHTPNSTLIYLQYTIKVPATLRDKLKQHLQDNYIPSAVYYPEPLHLQDGQTPGSLPVAEELAKTVLSLPLHAGLTVEQQTYVAQQVLSFLEKNL